METPICLGFPLDHFVMSIHMTTCLVMGVYKSFFVKPHSQQLAACLGHA